MKRVVISVLTSLAVALPVFASDEEALEKPWSISGGFDYLTQYLYRGYNTVPSGLIVQPYVDFYYTIFESGDLSISPHIGVWGDFTEKSGPHDPPHFAEGDINAGVSIDWAHFNLNINYNYQGYPSKYAPGGRVQSEVQEMQLLLTYDDSHCFEKLPLLASTTPHLYYTQEIKDLNDHDNNIYVEVGIEPAFKPIEVFKVPVTLSVPLALGLSTDSYYTNDDGHNEVVGYWLAGIKATFPIPVSEKLGAWSLVVECDYVSLQAQSVRDANTGDRDDIIGRIGVQFEL